MALTPDQEAIWQKSIVDLATQEPKAIKASKKILERWNQLPEDINILDLFKKDIPDVISYYVFDDNDIQDLLVTLMAKNYQERSGSDDA